MEQKKMELIIAEDYLDLLSREKIEKNAGVIEKTLNLSDVDYSVVFESDHFVQTLNKKYRQVNRPTDVLSFEADVLDPETKRRYLGDIVISVPTVQSQAKERNISFEDEIYVVLVHGILHLLGMDHGSEEEKSVMWKAQNQILKNLNVDAAAFPQ